MKPVSDHKLLELTQKHFSAGTSGTISRQEAVRIARSVVQFCQILLEIDRGDAIRANDRPVDTAERPSKAPLSQTLDANGSKHIPNSP